MDALAAPLLFFWMNLLAPEKPAQTEANKRMIAMLKAISGHEKNGLISLDGKWSMQEMYEATMDVSPGGFLMLRGDYGYLTHYFKIHGWELLPFMFEDRLIFRKPLRGSA